MGMGGGYFQNFFTGGYFGYTPPCTPLAAHTSNSVTN